VRVNIVAPGLSDAKNALEFLFCARRAAEPAQAGGRADPADPLRRRW
jgi:hypothetical protein